MAIDHSDNQGFLITKLKVPGLPSSVVPRGRLTQLLHKVAAYRVTLVIAPAGFGKTTLLSLWASENSLSTAWVSLDETDNDPVRFWRSFIMALQTLTPNIGQTTLNLLQAANLVSINDILTVLINDLVSIDNEFTIILDDYHHISAAAIHQALAFLVDHLPAQAHLLIASRIEPALPSLSRWRAYGLLFQIAPNELCFTLDETTTFLRNMKIQLQRGEIALLLERTEGWIAGLQLTALSLQNQTMQNKIDVRRFIQSFDGRNRYIGDYLADEVLRQQTKDVQQFLLGTAILSQLTAPLCDAVLDRCDSQAMLESFVSRSLFLFPLDEDRNWYRYHQLFADFLRDKGKRENPALVADLHQKASLWYQANGLPDEAIAHTLAIGDYERGVVLIQQSIPKVLWERGEIFTVQHWLAALPETILCNQAALLLTDAWLLIWSNQLAEAERCIDQAIRVPHSESTSVGEIAALRANIARNRGDTRRTIAFAEEALSYIGREEWLLRGMMHASIGGAFRLLGDITAAQEAYDQAYYHLKRSGSIHMTIHALGNLMQMQVRQGDFVRAEATYHQTLSIHTQTSRYLPTVGIIYLARGELLREQNELEKAEHNLAEGMALCQQWPGLVEARLEGYISLSRIALAKKAWREAADFLRQAENEAAQHEIAPWRARIAVEVADLRLLQGKLTDALRWKERLEALDNLAPDQRWFYLHHAEYVIVARILIAQGKLSKSVQILKQLHEAAAAFGLIHGLVETIILEAQVLYQEGHQTEAASYLLEALSIARPHKYIRLFIEAGEPRLAMLHLLTELRIDSSYLDLVSAASCEHPVSPDSVPLTKREIEVLKLVAVGLSNDEIAQELSVAIGTVRRHLHNIYLKFKTGNRTRSVARARELGLF